MAADVDQTPSGEDQDPSPTPSSRRVRSRFKLLYSLFIVASVPIIGFCIKYYQDTQEAGLKALGADGLFFFSSLDTDHDLYLSPEEFKPIAEKLTGVAPPPEYEEEIPHDPNGETLTLYAKMQPLLMESMTKSKDGFLGVSHSSLGGLRSWKRPAIPSTMLYASQFQVFLPPNGKSAVGDSWWIIPSELNIFTGYLPNNRYHPPAPQGREVLIHSLLSMFHPRPFVKSRFAPQGAVACIRGLSDFYYDIVFRIHAEFQLNDVPNFPFWFTPGQFTGHIVISKDASHVREFHLYVPHDKTLNVDMEWLYGPSETSNMEVDIGYLPQMELGAAGPSTPSVIYDEQGNLIESRGDGGEPIQFVFEDIVWSEKLSAEEASRRLEVTMCHIYRLVKPLVERQQRGSWFTPSCCSGRTLRETVLESSPVLALLNQSFISSWSLVKELEDLQGDEKNLDLSEKARLHLEKYTFPVQMMVVLPNGTVIHHINANNFLDQTSMKPEDGPAVSFSPGFEDPSTSTYIHFLQEGLEKAKLFLES
ncbi:hypothetical protein DNTS_016194 [Danionella cerebrum]|uniref:Uncharacterized protein n=1 Tax=Danionella cerebrum TaxID=2873325 RepID=A0A553Q0I4_9TELE|nr:hypothetical protein DNTS_016194 [Danionella translucida]